MLDGSKGSEGDQDYIFSLLTHATHLSLMTFCETTAGICKKWKCDVRTEGQTDIKSEIVMWMNNEYVSSVYISFHLIRIRN